MGIDTINYIERTEANVALTRQLFFQEAAHYQQLAEQRAFDKPFRTCDIEHEMRAIHAITGQAVDATAVFNHGELNARADTTIDNVEIDANGITPLTPEGTMKLADSFAARVNLAQHILSESQPDGLILPIGVQPLQHADDYRDFIVTDPNKRMRYALLEQVTIHENPSKTIVIRHPYSGETLVDIASNLSAMSRCSGTQIHISERTVNEALTVHNISIAIASIMIAIFGNSPYACGIDTGRVSTRIELLIHSEQLRAGLPLPAVTLEQYYTQQLGKIEPPFLEIDDPLRALQLAHGATHPISRIQVDPLNGTIRNELRHIDSQSPFRAMQAFYLTLGLIESLKTMHLPPYQESLYNFRHSVFGLETQMYWHRRKSSARVLALDFVRLACKWLRANGYALLAKRYLIPLLSEIKAGGSQANDMRQVVQREIHNGASRREAIIVGIRSWNKLALSNW
jgi:Glutamate-cysteine ligase family 2(GCS2)